MKRAILLATILLVSAAYQKLKQQPPAIGSKLPAKVVPKKNTRQYMTHSSQFRPFVEIDINNIKYLIAYDEKTREVRYVSTQDPDFKSSRGLSINDYVEVKGSDVEVYPGWEIRAPAEEDGWQPLIGFNGELTILTDQKESLLKLPLGQYRIPAEQIVKAKIIAFVKGSS